jgi:hypothetical protein
MSIVRSRSERIANPASRGEHRRGHGRAPVVTPHVDVAHRRRRTSSDDPGRVLARHDSSLTGNGERRADGREREAERAAQLAMLLDGIDLNAKRLARWNPPKGIDSDPGS